MKVKVVPLEEIEERVKQLLLGESRYEPLIILPGEYSQFIENHEDDEK